MNNEQELLAAAVDRELKRLPELRAPETLIDRVMAKIEPASTQSMPDVSWSSWPLRWRIVSMTSLAAIFCAGCLGVHWILRTHVSALLIQQLHQNFATASFAWNTLSVLADAAELAVQKLGLSFFAPGLVLMIAAYCLCVGVGTIMVKTATVHRKHL